MSETQDQNKTEEATPRRREQARDEGQVVFSPDLSAGVMLCTVGLFLFLFLPVVQKGFATPIAEALSGIQKREWNTNETILAGQWLFSKLLVITGVIFSLTTGTAILATYFQSGFTMTFQPLVPKWEKLSPNTGWNRLLSLDSLVRGALSLMKLATSACIGIALISIAIAEYRLHMAGILDSGSSIEIQLLLRILLSLSGITLLWGVVDYGFRKFRHEQKLKMSKQEVKDEHKEDQIDPQIRSKLRRAQQAAAQRRTLQDVPQATMVITNPTHYAVALKYQSGTMSAPVVIAKGADAFARRIAEVARENGVPVFQRKPLTRAIYALAEVGDEIPAEYYQAIAELLANVYRIRGQIGVSN